MFWNMPEQPTVIYIVKFNVMFKSVNLEQPGNIELAAKIYIHVNI
jgi:hypothetical protein